MIFKRLSEYFSKLEKETLRNKMTEILAELFREAGPSEIDKICYLLQGRVAPLFSSIEFGMADKMVIRAIAQGLGVDEKKVKQVYKQEGDLGKTVEKVKSQKSRQRRGSPKAAKVKSTSEKLKVEEVFNILEKVAKAGGEGSQEEKITLLANLLQNVDPLSTRYIARIPIGKLRLGFSDMTILDSFSWMLTGDKSLRKEIEKAYNVYPDLGAIAKQVKKGGVKLLRGVKPEIGTPILMARADRLSSASDILDKIGKCAIEFKYDGLRLQVHYKKVKSQKSKVKSQDKEDIIRLFSRNLEDVTRMFPDIVSAVTKQVKTAEVIFEGEVVAYNPETGVFISFQQTMQRKRKYDIEKKAAEIPVKLFAFELLYHEGKNYINEPYLQRKALLKKIIKPGTTIKYAKESLSNNEKKIEDLFDKSVELGFEGIIAKRLSGVYQAGMRGFNWIKFKRAMSRALMDTFDVLVMGYTKGKGKRTAFGVGQFLTGVKDTKQDRFVTLSKIGTGLTDEQFKEFRQRTRKLKIKQKPKEYEVDKLLEADVWLAPGLVVEVAADQITRSQVHTAGRVMKPSKSGKAYAVRSAGFALRFPRLISFRDDKGPGDVTTVLEVKKMFGQQKKKRRKVKK